MKSIKHLCVISIVLFILFLIYYCVNKSNEIQSPEDIFVDDNEEWLAVGEWISSEDPDCKAAQLRGEYSIFQATSENAPSVFRVKLERLPLAVELLRETSFYEIDKYMLEQMIESVPAECKNLIPYLVRCAQDVSEGSNYNDRPRDACAHVSWNRKTKTLWVRSDPNAWHPEIIVKRVPIVVFLEEKPQKVFYMGLRWAR